MLRKGEKKLPRIGVDERAFAKGQSYITLLDDLDYRTNRAISDGNDTNARVECLSQLSEQQNNRPEEAAR